MMYVTHRGLNATVQSMQATGQITEETAEQVLNIADPMRNGISWKKVSGWIQDEVAGSEKIIAIHRRPMLRSQPGMRKSRFFYRTKIVAYS